MEKTSVNVRNLSPDSYLLTKLCDPSIVFDSWRFCLLGYLWWKSLKVFLPVVWFLISVLHLEVDRGNLMCEVSCG